MSTQAAQSATVRLGPFDAHGTTRAEVDGRSTEVEHGIPDELVTIELFAGRRPRGRIIEVLEASPDRVPPPCAYFREWSCGGCQWQHIAYRAQLARKRDDIDTAMRRAGISATVDAVYALDDPWLYRSTASIALGRHAGFRRHGSLAIVPIDDCLISHPLISDLMARLNAQLAAGSLPDFRGRVRLDARVAQRHAAEALHILIRLDADRPPADDLLLGLAATLTDLAIVQTVLLADPAGGIQVLSGEMFGAISLAGHTIVMSAAAFFQTNLNLLPRLIHRLRELSVPLGGKRVADVYGGVGIFGLALAHDAEEVSIVESNPIALHCAERTAAQQGLRNVRLIAGSASEALASLTGCELIILDPPRAGLDAAVIGQLLRHRPARILYISCLAESLARDLAALAANYSVQKLELFDFYPQTYHVELLAVLDRK